MSEVPLYGIGTPKMNSHVGNRAYALRRCEDVIRVQEGLQVYGGTLLIRKRHPMGPYSRAIPRALWWS